MVHMCHCPHICAGTPTRQNQQARMKVQGHQQLPMVDC